MAPAGRILLVDEYLPPEPEARREVREAPASPPYGTSMHHLDVFAQGVRDYESFSRGTARGVRRLVADVKSDPPENLGDIIARLQEIEERGASRLGPLRESFAKSRRMLARDPDPRFKIKALTYLDRQEAAIVEALGALRDARWELMAFRAGMEKQKGQIFDDPEAVARYFDANSK